MYSYLKRFLDIIFSLFSLIVFLPLFFIISIALKLDSKGPIIFRQTKIGKNGKEFILLKFRTTYQNIDSNNIINIVDNKITRVGYFLRALGLDELPQLINILKGDMSCIGPRPALVYEFKHYEGWQKERLNVRPGMTGYRQVYGKLDDSFDDKIKLDIKYVRNISFILDLKILFKTMSILFLQLSKEEDVQSSENT
jgi:lipopolysaccharide/colanic/teichoic acid biosynthesis glycosyltransferase